MSLSNIVDTDVNKWDYLREFVPGLDYHKITSNYRDPNNIVGHQQRAFVIYWAMREHERVKEWDEEIGIGIGTGMGIEPGCGQAISPFCIGTDFYAGSNHPQYGGAYWPHVRCMGEILPFKDEMFDFIVSHHSLEHMKDTLGTLREWLRVLRSEGKIAIVMPDKNYGPFGDKGHVSEMTADEFKKILDRLVQENKIRIIEHDTFKNNFSYNTVIEKI